MCDDKYAVMCVQHDYTPKPGIKMDGKQTIYQEKIGVHWFYGIAGIQAIKQSLKNSLTILKQLEKFYIVLVG